VPRPPAGDVAEKLAEAVIAWPLADDGQGSLPTIDPAAPGTSMYGSVAEVPMDLNGAYVEPQDVGFPEGNYAQPLGQEVWGREEQLIPVMDPDYSDDQLIPYADDDADGLIPVGDDDALQPVPSGAGDAGLGVPAIAGDDWYGSDPAAYFVDHTSAAFAGQVEAPVAASEHWEPRYSSFVDDATSDAAYTADLPPARERRLEQGASRSGAQTLP